MPTHYQGDPQTERALSAYINFSRGASSLAARLDAQIASSGLTTGQFAVLEALFHLGPLSQHALCHKLLRSAGNVTVVVDNLEKRGWVRRERQQDDRRVVVLHLSPTGRRLIARIFPEHARAITAEMNRLTADEQETLRRLSRRLGAH